MGDEPYVHYYDSLTFEADSLLVYRLVAIERADTLYDRLEMIIQSDSLSVCDTLPLPDTLASTKDTVATSSIEELKRKMEEMKNSSPVKRLVRGAIQKDSVEKRSNLKSTNNLWQLSE